MATVKQRARRHRMAVAHAERRDVRQEPVSGIRADDRRRVLREQRRAQRRQARKAAAR